MQNVEILTRIFILGKKKILPKPLHIYYFPKLEMHNVLLDLITMQ